VLVSSILNIDEEFPNVSGEIFSYIFSNFLILTYSMMIIFITIWLVIYKNKEKKDGLKILKNILDDLDQNKTLSTITFYGIFTLRRLVIIIIIFVFKNHLVI
jgi:hypothetical protein